MDEHLLYEDKQLCRHSRSKIDNSLKFSGHSHFEWLSDIFERMRCSLASVRRSKYSLLKTASDDELFIRSLLKWYLTFSLWQFIRS